MTQRRIHAPVIGVDVGQSHDPTALCVAEEDERTVAGRSTVHWLVRHLERLPLGTPYPAVVERLEAVIDHAADRAGLRPVLLVDATGVGKPIVDRLRTLAPPADLWAVQFVSGSRCTLDRAKRHLRAGKQRIIRHLEIALEQGRVHLPSTREADALARELQTFERRIDTNGSVRLEAFRHGTHDDLVTALALVVLAQGIG
ncbi:MAG: hypothetical protein AAGC60_05565 [Acidobacteriota bacterium]